MEAVLPPLSSLEAVYFILPTTLARTSSMVLNRSGKSRPPCLVPDLKGREASLSPQCRMFLRLL